MKLAAAFARSRVSRHGGKMFDCEMHVPGNGRGGNGRFKKDQTAPVSRFMVDNVYLYPKVKQHIVACDKCDPTEALRFYLDRRLTLDKFKPRAGQVWPVAGVVTGTLANLALSYERLCRDTRPIPRELVNEFVWRSTDHDIIAKHENRLSVRELVGAAELFLKVHSGRQSANEATMLGKVCMLLEHHARPETAEEMELLIAVMEVQLI